MIDTMKAYVRTNHQSTNVELQEVQIPEIDANEVLIRVHAFGVGIHDRYFIPGDAVFPYTIVGEGAGVIAKIGESVSGVTKGERVIFSSSMRPKGGCWAEYVIVTPETIVQMPDDMDMNIGAVLPVAGKTALESFRELHVSEGDTLFIAGATGAIGTLIIQLAKAQGVRVIGSASGRNHAYMKELGAEAAVDYNDVNWKEEVLAWAPGGVDSALAIQPGTGEDCMDVVKNNGRVITVSGDSVPSTSEVVVKQFDHLLDIQTAVERIIEYMEAGTLSIKIEQEYPFEKALEALEKTETRHARGKLVVIL